MKTGINQIIAATIFTLVFLGGNVSAKGTEVKASGLENIKETALVVENWMISDNYWNARERTFIVQQETDGELALETWMTSDDIWDVNQSSAMEPETEQDLLLEFWMINEMYWSK